MSAHGKAQLLRLLRLAAFALLAQPAVASLVSSTLLRYPLIAALVAAAEVVVREVWPTKSIPVSGEPVLLSPSQGSAVTGPTSPMHGIVVQPGETGMASNPPPPDSPTG